ncbi:MAG: ABC transporter substrate-binding protein [Planctomycetaceae bacterium]|nr:ABC transporter substrate-binding protein [Planctomycetaceae bacterium]
MTRRLHNFYWALLIGIALLTLTAGCPKQSVNTDSRDAFWQSVAPGSQFTLLVVGDAEVAKKIRQTVGTWEELTQATLTVDEITVGDLLAGGHKPKADAVICPMELQATLVQLGYPTKITPDMYESSIELWDDLLETYRTKLSRFGTETMFVPFGSQFFVCYYRADLLKKIKESPPANWADYEKLRVKLQALSDAPANWSGAIEPTAPGWAGYAFLARAASYATHRDYYSTLFDMKTMSPLIATEPFVRALTEMRTANPPGTPKRSNDEVRRAFWRGECAIAVTWPTAAAVTDPPETAEQVITDRRGENFEAGMTMLPGSALAYNTEKKIWDDRRPGEPTNIPTLVVGHVGMVSAETSDPVGMFKLLLWLSGKEWGTDVFASSALSGIGRYSELDQILRWVEKEAAPVSLKYSTVLSNHWKANEVFVFPSLPGYAEYMAALDREVSQVLDGHKEPQVALDEVARQWDAITREHGIESQRKLYRQCSGLNAD